jgi:thioester reductase-like protein
MQADPLCLDRLCLWHCLLLGYLQSKWVAEKILDLARARGLPVYIYRPGVLIGDSRTGIWDNPDDFLCRAIKGCIQLGAWPTLDGPLYLTPVDYVGRAIVHLSQHAAGPRTVFHLVNPHPLPFPNLFEWTASLGYPMEALPLQAWQTKLKTEVRKPQDNTLAVLIPILAKRRATVEPETLPDLFEQGRIPRADCQNALAGLANSDIACPALTREHFRAYLSYFVKTGFLAAPNGFSSLG